MAEQAALAETGPLAGRLSDWSGLTWVHHPIRVVGRVGPALWRLPDGSHSERRR